MNWVIYILVLLGYVLNACCPPSFNDSVHLSFVMVLLGSLEYEFDECSVKVAHYPKLFGIGD